MSSVECEKCVECVGCERVYLREHRSHSYTYPVSPGCSSKELPQPPDGSGEYNYYELVSCAAGKLTSSTHFIARTSLYLDTHTQ